ncbi:hypothetical protein BB559_007235 [Furculomyces boomerangus]|uniref:1-phosphatidylinositol-3-phosphate 5-kinase n=1 Tax=Furculomyces boomerangus TaxID=61424 RepID=A0A2T9XYC4_9FUNG|nr:hypothetical protein BB559_007235 [Furculomyces boomerangus]
MTNLESNPNVDLTNKKDPNKHPSNIKTSPPTSPILKTSILSEQQLDKILEFAIENNQNLSILDSIPQFVKPVSVGSIHPFYGDYTVKNLSAHPKLPICLFSPSEDSVSNYSPPSTNSTSQVPNTKTTNFQNIDPNLNSKQQIKNNSIQNTLQTTPSEITSQQKRLLVAVETGSLTVVKKLIKQWKEVGDISLSLSSPSGTNGLTPLMYAASRGHTEVAAELLNAGALVDSTDVEGETALLKAAYCGHIDCLNCLLSHGANPSIADKDGWNSLHNAAGRGHFEIVCTLVENGGINIAAQNNQGHTALMNAASKGHFLIVKYLLSTGNSGLNLKNNFGENAYDVAAIGMHVDICNILEEAERLDWLKRKATGIESDNWNPLAVHTAQLVIIYENERSKGSVKKTIEKESPPTGIQVVSAALSFPFSFISKLNGSDKSNSQSTTNPKPNRYSTISSTHRNKHNNTTSTTTGTPSNITQIQVYVPTNFSAYNLIVGSDPPRWCNKKMEPCTPDEVQLPQEESCTDSENVWFWLSEWLLYTNLPKNIESNDPIYPSDSNTETKKNKEIPIRKSLDIYEEDSQATDQDGWRYCKDGFNLPDGVWGPFPEQIYHRDLGHDLLFVRRRMWIRVMKKRITIADPYLPNNSIPETNKKDINSGLENLNEDNQIPDDIISDPVTKIDHIDETLNEIEYRTETITIKENKVVQQAYSNDSSNQILDLEHDQLLVIENNEQQKEQPVDIGTINSKTHTKDIDADAESESLGPLGHLFNSVKNECDNELKSLPGDKNIASETGVVNKTIVNNTSNDNPESKISTIDNGSLKKNPSLNTEDPANIDGNFQNDLIQEDKNKLKIGKMNETLFINYDKPEPIHNPEFSVNRDKKVILPIQNITQKIPKELLVYQNAVNQLPNVESIFKQLIRQYSSAMATRQYMPEHAWLPDSSAPYCALCKRKFKLFFRRHHCRRCGLVFCDDCTKDRDWLASRVYSLDDTENNNRLPLVLSNASVKGIILASLLLNNIGFDIYNPQDNNQTSIHHKDKTLEANKKRENNDLSNFGDLKLSEKNSSTDFGHIQNAFNVKPVSVDMFNNVLKSNSKHQSEPQSLYLLENHRVCKPCKSKLIQEENNLPKPILDYFKIIAKSKDSDMMQNEMNIYNLFGEKYMGKNESTVLGSSSNLEISGLGDNQTLTQKNKSSNVPGPEDANDYNNNVLSLIGDPGLVLEVSLSHSEDVALMLVQTALPAILRYTVPQVEWLPQTFQIYSDSINKLESIIDKNKIVFPNVKTLKENQNIGGYPSKIMDNTESMDYDEIEGPYTESNNESKDFDNQKGEPTEILKDLSMEDMASNNIGENIEVGKGGVQDIHKQESLNELESRSFVTVEKKLVESEILNLFKRVFVNMLGAIVDTSFGNIAIFNGLEGLKNSENLSIKHVSRRYKLNRVNVECPVCNLPWAQLWKSILRSPSEGWQESQEKHIRECLFNMEYSISGRSTVRNDRDPTFGNSGLMSVSENNLNDPNNHSSAGLAININNSRNTSINGTGDYGNDGTDNPVNTYPHTYDTSLQNHKRGKLNRPQSTISIITNENVQSETTISNHQKHDKNGKFNTASDSEIPSSFNTHKSNSYPLPHNTETIDDDINVMRKTSLKHNSFPNKQRASISQSIPFTMESRSQPETKLSTGVQLEENKFVSSSVRGTFGVGNGEGSSSNVETGQNGLVDFATALASTSIEMGNGLSGEIDVRESSSSGIASMLFTQLGGVIATGINRINPLKNVPSPSQNRNDGMIETDQENQNRNMPKSIFGRISIPTFSFSGISQDLQQTNYQQEYRENRPALNIDPNESLKSPKPVPVRYISYKLNEDTPMLGQECSICFDEFEAGDNVARLSCFCTFHTKCIRNWFKRNPNCPIHYN